MSDLNDGVATVGGSLSIASSRVGAVMPMSDLHPRLLRTCAGGHASLRVQADRGACGSTAACDSWRMALPRQRARRLLVLTATLVILAGAMFGTVNSLPRKLNLDNASTHAVAASRTLQQSYLVENKSGSDVRIIGLDANVSSVELVSTNVGAGVDIPPHDATWLRMTFHVTGCRNLPSGPLPVHLRISRWYGTETITEWDQGTDYDDAFTACGK